MKKFNKIIVLILCLVLGVTALIGCDDEKDILVISRESGSGTRDGFDGLVKNAAGDSLAKKADGTLQPSNNFVETMDTQTSTANIRTKVSANKSAIGYISLGSLNDFVKAVSINGVVPSKVTVLDGTYAIKRPFVIMTKKDLALTAAAADFLKYLSSSTAQAIVDANGFVKQEIGKGGAYIASAVAISGTILVKGSSSMDDLMDELIADYNSKKGSLNTCTINKNAIDSAAGRTDVKADTVGNIIGMSSSALGTADKALIDDFNIALDAIAVIVHKDNTITNLTIAQIFDIYTGVITKFSEIK